MSQGKKDLKYAIEILAQEPDRRSQSDLEFLAMFLLFLEDFRKYIIKLNNVLKYQLCRRLTIESYQKDDLIFNKGDPSDKYYIILRGSVNAINVDSDGAETIIGKVGPGKQLGERGVIKNLPRNLKISAAEKALLLALSGTDFKTILGDYVRQFLDQKVQFLITYVPYVVKYSSAHRERAAYAMNMEYFKRGDKIIQEGGTCEVLYFVYEGECVICTKDRNKDQHLSKLTTGMCFGEECVLLGRSAIWTVVDFSEYTAVLTIKRYDLMTSFPPESVESLKESFNLKIRGREFLRHSKSNSLQLDDSSAITQKISDSGVRFFPLASNYARKRLYEFAIRDTSRTRNNSREGQRFQKEIESLRLLSFSRQGPPIRSMMTPDLKDIRLIKGRDHDIHSRRKTSRNRSRMSSLLF